jgi:RHS repeat-associated protein
VNGQAYTWDNNGNLTDDGSKTYTYTQDNKLVAISATGLTWSAAYNGDGARRRQSVNGAVTTYTLDLAAPLVTVLAEQQATSNNTYLYALGDSPIASYDGADWTYLSGRDGLGSVRQETDASGNVLTTRSFDPYGVVMQGDGGSPFGYTGEQYDTYIKLMFLRARYLNPALGMFLAEDIKPTNIMRPSDGGMYLYVNGNPINYTDPSGWCVFCDGGRVKVDARPDNVTFIYARPDATSARVISVPDEERVRILPEPMQNGWRKVTFLGQVGWIENQKLLDNCDGPPGTFACLPVKSSLDWTGGFGPNHFACDTCGNPKSEECDAHNNPLNNCQYCWLRGLHNGLDFGAPANSPLVWPGTGEGTVLDNPYPGDAAVPNNIVIGFDGVDVLFGHVSIRYPGAIYAKEKVIRPGQTIGESGSDHLHLGVRSGNVFYNPLGRFASALQQRIVAGMEPYPAGYEAYSVVSFDEDQGGWFWEDCPDLGGIIFSPPGHPYIPY